MYQKFRFFGDLVVIQQYKKGTFDVEYESFYMMNAEDGISIFFTPHLSNFVRNHLLNRSCPKKASLKVCGLNTVNGALTKSFSKNDNNYVAKLFSRGH